MKKKKEKIIYLSAIAIIVIILIVGVTYALWQISHKQEGENLVEAGCFDISISAGTGMFHDGMIPMSDTEGMNTTPYTFTLTNNCSIVSKYYVNIEIMEESTLSESNIKNKVDNLTSKLLTSYNEVNPSLNNATTAYEIYTGYLYPETSITHDIRNWVKEDADHGSIVGQSLETKVTITALPESVEVEELAVTNGKLVLSNTNELIQLKGYSSHGLQWYEKFINQDSIDWMKNQNLNVLRIAMYTAEEGYLTDKERTVEEVYRLTDLLIENDMYVIMDWHIAKDNNPLDGLVEAKAFFEEYALKYKNVPNILYEICNEPNGDDITWDIIEEYANDVIPFIRNINPDAIMIVGTPRYSSHFEAVVPLSYDNVMYTHHNYEHDYDYTTQAKIDSFDEYYTNRNLPMFLTEIGIQDNQMLEENYDKLMTWIEYLDENKISYTIWSFANPKETTSISRTMTNEYKPGYDIDTYITPLGQILKDYYTNK